MDPNTANIVQTAILAGVTGIIAAIVIGTRAWIRVNQINAEAHKQGDYETSAAVEALRKEVASLRDTTTRYDISFDTALQRLESRTTHLELGQRASSERSQEAVVNRDGGPAGER